MKKTILRIIIFDVIILIVLSINLFLLIFDWLYSYDLFNIYLKYHWHGFYNFYLPYHLYFWKIDLVFVSIYWIEIIIQWFVAILRKKQNYWYSYPFHHWYDVIGSIPIGTLHWLRLLRFISIFYRLNRLQLIDISKNLIFKKLNHWLDILSEEISDRVVVNILSGAQEEIKEGTPVFEKINSKILLPRMNQLVEISINKLSTISDQFYFNYQYEIKEYIKEKVENAITENKELKTLSKIPVVGRTINSSLQNAIADVIHDIVKQIITDFNVDKNQEKMKEIIWFIYKSLFANTDNKTSNSIVSESLIEILEIVKEQVKVQQWKLKELKLKKELLHNKAGKLSGEEKKELLLKIVKIEEQINSAKIKTPLFKIDDKFDLIDLNE